MALAANSLEGKSQNFLKRIETINADADSARGTYMAECQVRNEDRKEIYTEAKGAGVPVRALKGLVKKRALQRKADAIADGLDMDESAAYETLCEALGDLGRAAAKRAGHAPKDDDEKDLRPDNLKQADKERADADALSKIGRGPEAKAAAVDSLAAKH